MATSEVSSRSVQLHALVDDAGLFPPEKLPMAAALARHRRDSAADNPVLSHRFLCPVTSGQELIDQLVADDVLAVILLGALNDEATTVIGALQEHPQVTVEGFETTLPAAGHRDTFEQRLRSTSMPADLFIEVPLGEGLSEDLARLAAWGAGAKVRCGGVTAAAFPAPSALATFLHAVVDQGIAFKATAGLHHALAHHDPATGFDHFGFLNLLASTALARAGAPVSEIAALLTDPDASSVLGALAGADLHVRDSFRSFGSCSTAEPIEDLVGLGLIGSGPSSTTEGSPS